MAAEHDRAISGDVEAIHRLRVATRRLRAALRLLREVALDQQDTNRVAGTRLRSFAARAR